MLFDRRRGQAEPTVFWENEKKVSGWKMLAGTILINSYLAQKPVHVDASVCHHHCRIRLAYSGVDLHWGRSSYRRRIGRHLCHHPIVAESHATDPSNRMDMAPRLSSSESNHSIASYRRESSWAHRSIYFWPHSPRWPSRWIVWPIPIDCWLVRRFGTAAVRSNCHWDRKNDIVAWFRTIAMIAISMCSARSLALRPAIAMSWVHRCHDNHRLNFYLPNKMLPPTSHRHHWNSIRLLRLRQLPLHHWRRQFLHPTTRCTIHDVPNRWDSCKFRHCPDSRTNWNVLHSSDRECMWVRQLLKQAKSY